MRILSLDTAGGACAVCIWYNGDVVAIAEEQMARGQDARLVPLVLDVLERANVTFDQLDRIAVTRGPGSFTGLRIGLATARGFGLAANKPVIGVDRFSLYREQQASATDDVLVVLESKRLELYCRLYPAHDSPREACMMVPDEIVQFARQKARLTLAGDALDLVRPRLQESVAYAESDEAEVVTCAKIVAAIATDDPAYLPRPYYLRAPDVTVSGGKNKGV